MSVRRKGPKATAARVGAYALLVLVAVIVIFPFVVAVATSFKSSDDIFSYPPTLMPSEAATVEGRDGTQVSVFTLPEEEGTWALVETDVSLAEFRPLDDPEKVITVEPSAGEKNGESVMVDGDEEDLYVVTVDGAEVVAYRARLTSGGRFENVDDPSRTALALVNFAEPAERFGPRPENYSEVWTDKDLGRSLTNTVLVTVLVVMGQLLTSILGGYAFARIDFRGRNKLFMLYLGSVMVPFVVLIIPLFQLVLQLGWLDNIAALIIPFTFTAYGTFLMRQFFVGIPKEIEEAALLDNASRSTILWKIMVPLARPAIATLATFGFLHAWNSFFWPLVIINSGNPEARVLSLALSTLGGRSSTDINLVFAGAVIAMTPPILVFLFAQRYFVENSASSGLK